MKRSLLLALMPVSLAAAVALPVAAPGWPYQSAGASPDASRPAVAMAALPEAAGRPAPSASAELRTALESALQDAVPGAAANGIHVLALQHAPIGIGGWHRAAGTAQVGSGATATTLRFGGRVEAGTQRVEALRVRWDARAAAPVDGPARVAIERAAREVLAEEFPQQAPAFELVGLVREPTLEASAAQRVFRGRGRIDFGPEGTVLAPVEVVLDDEARVVALRYSLDELDPAPFEGAGVATAEGLAAR